LAGTWEARRRKPAGWRQGPRRPQPVHVPHWTFAEEPFVLAVEIESVAIADQVTVAARVIILTEQELEAVIDRIATHPSSALVTLEIKILVNRAVGGCSAGTPNPNRGNTIGNAGLSGCVITLIAAEGDIVLCIHDLSPELAPPSAG
jgi:hypothetical protein